MAVALVASLVMAAILAFIAESMDGRIRTSEQMESLTGFPALAMVPEKPENWGDLPPYVAIIERPCSAFSEALRSVRSEAHTSELQSIMPNSYAVICLKKKQYTQNNSV